MLYLIHSVEKELTYILAEMATQILYMLNIFEKETWSLSTWKYIDSGLVKCHWTDVDMQIFNLLGCKYKQQKNGSVGNSFVSLVFGISTSVWDMELEWKVMLEAIRGTERMHYSSVGRANLLQAILAS